MQEICIDCAKRQDNDYIGCGGLTGSLNCLMPDWLVSGLTNSCSLIATSSYSLHMWVDVFYCENFLIAMTTTKMKCVSLLCHLLAASLLWKERLIVVSQEAEWCPLFERMGGSACRSILSQDKPCFHQVVLYGRYFFVFPLSKAMNGTLKEWTVPVQFCCSGCTWYEPTVVH